MKILISILVLMTFMLSSCKKSSVIDPFVGGLGNNCENVLEPYMASITAYSSNPTVANCNKVKSTLTDVVNKCSMFTAAQRDDYKNELKDWDCNS